MMRVRTRDRSGVVAWYKSSSYLADNTMPTLILDFANNRYAAQGVQKPLTDLFTFSRTTMATYTGPDRMPTTCPMNLLPDSEIAGAVVGVIGSGGSLPTGWFWGGVGAAALTREVLAVGADYVDIRLYGSNTSGVTVYPGINFSPTPITPIVGVNVCASVYVQIIGGSLAGATNIGFAKTYIQWENSGSFISNTTPSAQPTTTMTRLYSIGSRVTNDYNQMRHFFHLSVDHGNVIDISLRIKSPQLEHTFASVPKDYIETKGTAYYGLRLAYDPTTTESLGAQFEGAGTNVMTNNYTVTGTGTTGTNLNAVGPTGLANTADTVVCDGASSAHFAYKNSITGVSGTDIVISVFVKTTNISFLQIYASSAHTDSTNTHVNINMSTGETWGAAGVVAHGSISYPNGWYRVWARVPQNASGTGAGLVVSVVDTLTTATRSPNVTTSGTYYVAFWQREDVSGANLQSGPSSFIPTGTAAVTRGADVLQSTSANVVPFATWYPAPQAIGSVKAIIRHDYTPGSSSMRVATIGNATGTELISICKNASSVQVFRTVGGVIEYSPNSTYSPPAGTFIRQGAFYANNDFNVVADGGTIGSDATAPMPSTIDRAWIGSTLGTGLCLAGFMKKFVFYYARISNSEMQRITTYD